MTEDGIVYIRKNRRTGTRVALIDTSAPECVFDSAGGRWVTLCTVHGSLCNHRTRKTAESFVAYPESFCEQCAGDEHAL